MRHDKCNLELGSQIHIFQIKNSFDKKAFLSPTSFKLCEYKLSILDYKKRKYIKKHLFKKKYLEIVQFCFYRVF